MDTVVLRVFDVDHEKLVTRIRKASELHVRCERTGKRVHHRPYQICEARQLWGKKFFIAMSPRPNPHYDPAPLVFEFHLSHFKNFSEVLSWLKRLCGRYFEIVIDADIGQLDCAIDVGIPINELQRVLICKRGRNVIEFKSSAP